MHFAVEHLKNGIEPLVTLSHFEIPLELIIKYGGWKNRTAIELFVKYTTTVLKRYKGKVKCWLTFNEINMMEHVQSMTIGVLESNPQAKANAALHQFSSYGTAMYRLVENIQTIS